MEINLRLKVDAKVERLDFNKSYKIKRQIFQDQVKLILQLLNKQ